MTQQSQDDPSGAYRHVDNYSNAVRAYREFLSAVGAALTEMRAEPPNWIKPVMDELKVEYPEADLAAVAQQLIELADRAQQLEEREPSAGEGEPKSLELQLEDRQRQHSSDL